MSSGPSPKYQKAGTWTALPVLLLLLLFVVTGAIAAGLVGALVGFFGFLLMLVLPVAIWDAILPRASAGLFDAFVFDRAFEKHLRKMRVNVPPAHEYFRVDSSLPKSTTWRVLQIVSIVIIVASYLTLILRSLSLVTVQSEPAVFFFLALGTLCLGVPMVVGVLWVYEDAGVRRLDSSTGTISRIGTPLEQFFVGFGFASAFARFVYSLQEGTATAWGTGVALLILLLPICAFVVVYFHSEYYAGVINRFLDSETGKRIPNRVISLDS